MKPINMDTEIVATMFNKVTNTVAYTVERDGERWTVNIPVKELDAIGPISLTKKQRMDFVGRKLQQVMMGPGDPAPAKPNPT